jgi:DNA-binding NarL/FixJ family response regulator
VPVIIYTAYDTFRDDSRLSLADGYILKSTDFRALKQKIANVLLEQQFFSMSYEKNLCFENSNTLTN